MKDSLLNLRLRTGQKQQSQWRFYTAKARSQPAHMCHENGVTFIATRHQQLSVMGTCALVLNTCLLKHQYTLLQLETLVPLPLFTVALGDDVSGDMSRGIKLEHQEWLGPDASQARHCGSERCLSVCLSVLFLLTSQK